MTQADTGSNPLTRRTLLRGTAHAAWAVPVVSVASAAPAFAASGVETPPGTTLECTVSGYRETGQGKHNHDYFVAVGCTSGTVHSVKIQDDGDGWRAANDLGNGLWSVRGLDNSRITRGVLLNGTDQFAVEFPVRNS